MNKWKYKIKFNCFVRDSHRFFKIIRKEERKKKFRRLPTRTIKRRDDKNHSKWWDDDDKHKSTKATTTINIKLFRALKYLTSNRRFPSFYIAIKNYAKQWQINRSLRVKKKMYSSWKLILSSFSTWLFLVYYIFNLQKATHTSEWIKSEA
jgi:hypothetical protein